MANISNGLAALSVLTGTNATAAFAESAVAIETRAQRKARAAFTTPEVAPPWRDKPSTLPESAQISAIKAMKTIIDKPAVGPAALPEDVQTTFTTYKALDRLRLLSEAASKATTSSTERASLQKTFAKGLADLKTFLGSAPSELVDLAFGSTARHAQTVGVASPSSLTMPTITGTGVRETRAGALEGFTGNEVLRVDLSASGIADSVTVDLSTTPQPPTLDSVADALNAAIAAVPRRDTAGEIVRDAEGNAVPRWEVAFEPAKTGEKWGMSVKRAGFETISIDQVGGGDAIMVATGVKGTDAPVDTRISRFDDPTGTMTRRTLDTITSIDRAATERSQIAADADETDKLKAKTVAADTVPRAMVTDAQGFSYIVGTSAGDIGGNLSDGDDDLFLTKVDSEGSVVWQRGLGAGGSATGAALAIGPDGGIVVAGTVTGNFDGANSDGDLFVARFDPLGNEGVSSLVRSVGAQTASAVAVGDDGTIYVGGDNGRGGAVIARIDAAGKLTQQRVIDGAGTDQVKALAIAGDGALLALTGEGGTATLRRIDAEALATDLGQVSLGTADARAIAVADDGRIAVVGSTGGSLPGGQGTTNGGRDAFVARIDPDLSDASVTYIGSAGEDEADSVAFLAGDIYVGGRTGGMLAGAKTGTTDGFVTRVDAVTGAIGDTRQFGVIGARTDTVQVSAIAGGNSVLGALGLNRGTLTPTDSVKLEAQTALRAGDEFSIRVNGGGLRKIVIGENDTLTTLADRLRSVVGNRVASVTTPAKGTGRSLRIDVKPGMQIELIAGAAGKDALAKLGLEARRIVTPANLADDAPRVRPGGSFALDLTQALRLDTKSEASNALGQIKQALSFSQSAYRSLYWDDTKAALADTPVGKGRRPGSTVIEKAQLANYQAALDRLAGGGASFTGF